MSDTQGSKITDENEEINYSAASEAPVRDEDEKQIEGNTKIESPEETMLGTITAKQSEPQDPPVNLPKPPASDEPRRQPAVKKPMSPFAKFRQLDRQNSGPLSAPSSPKTPGTPGGKFSFKFTDPVVQNNVVQIKERLLAWCRAKTKEYENIQIENFSTSWNNGLAFCALLHHFRPAAFDYSTLKAQNRRSNFELAFTKAEEIADIAPLLDVEDMVVMQRPDWKCVFTYVQSIYRRFKDED